MARVPTISTIRGRLARLGDIGLQAALLHGHLSFFELELADADFDVPGDWARIERMLSAGVRVGMIDDVLAEYWPSTKGWDPESA